MEIKVLKPRKALNKAFLKLKPNRIEIDGFKANLIQLLDRSNDAESEEFHKNLVADFMKKTYYDPAHYINTKGRNDQVIHNGPNAESTVGVIIEAKKFGNKSEMVNRDKLNVKAFQEMVLYYLRERISHKNLEIKHLVITNIYEWFIFDASVFEQLFAQNKGFLKQFVEFENGRLAGKTTDFFYKEIAWPFIENIHQEIEFTYVDIREYQQPLRNNNKADDNKLISLFKLLSPEHLLKLPFANDSNSLDKRFYSELLHIIGLTETKEGGKKFIRRNKPGERHTGSIVEDTIIQLDSLEKITRLPKPNQFGENYEDRLFNIALELSITWINRILFLKLLEAQLINYHKGDQSYAFLSQDKISSYDDLNSLFFQVLARKPHERNDDVRNEFEKVPYLNSSLFEPTEIEHSTLFISNLRHDKSISIISTTVLKTDQGKRRTGQLSTLGYLFEFLNAYDFSSEGSEEIQEENKTLINASVLGLIFEKINGYKDGSFFTPGFITMYMCRETIRRAVVQKFNEVKNWQCNDFSELTEDLKQQIRTDNRGRKEVRREANNIINEIKICDPAVGSGHFLVSALNEMISIKSELGILADQGYEPLNDCVIEVANDELVVTNLDGELFEYNFKNKASQRIQETLFNEKQTIIENCLFGVDINPNSVKICRLRLWIELLKNAYYHKLVETLQSSYPVVYELETLPNIDINIKCGNSLVSRFSLESGLGQALKKSTWTIDTYRIAVSTYRNAENREQKRAMEKLIAEIKSDFRSEITLNDPKAKRLRKTQGELFTLTNQNQLFDKSEKEKEEWNKQVKKLTDEITQLEAEIEEIKNNKVFENALEWRFEFPEVLDDEGKFAGFDVVIGNPPYIQLQKDGGMLAKSLVNQNYQTYIKTGDIYMLFYERGFQILKENGFQCFITSSQWMKAAYGASLRQFLLDFNNLSIVSLGPNIFENATVDTSILVSQKAANQLNLIGSIINDQKELAEETFSKIALPYFDEHAWVIMNPIKLSIHQKLQTHGTKLTDWKVTIYRGLLTGFNQAFLIDESIKSKLINENINATQLIKPILRGREVEKYFTRDAQTYLILIPKGYTIKRNLPEDSPFFVKEPMPRYGTMDLDDAWEWLTDNFPSISTHLHPFRSDAEKRQDQGDFWWELRACDYYEDFEKPKLIWKRIGSKIRFCYDETATFSLDSTCIATGEKMKYLVALLNSKLCQYQMFEQAPRTGMGDLILSVQALEPIFVHYPSDETELEINALVDKIFNAKKNDENTTALESKIDQIIYQLYELTEQEIAVIEESLEAK